MGLKYAQIKKLADLLRRDARNRKGLKFHMGTWGRRRNFQKPMGLNCNTTACAMGAAALSGIFAEQGLTGEAYVYVGAEGRSEGSNIDFKWHGRTASNPISLAQRLFGFTYDEAAALFTGNLSKFQRGAKAELEMASTLSKIATKKARIGWRVVSQARSPVPALVPIKKRK